MDREQAWQKWEREQFPDQTLNPIMAESYRHALVAGYDAALALAAYHAAIQPAEAPQIAP